MDDKREAFRKKMDQLIKLFRRLKDKEKENLQNMAGVDPYMYQSFEMFLNNYDSMKDQITDDLLNQFGDQMQFMISNLVDQLKEEMGDDFDFEEEEEDTIETINIEEEIPEALKESGLDENVKEVMIIDEKLKNSKLTPEEVDRLLDKRSKLTGGL
ncbi:MAG: hypothetical protein ACEPOV_12780 [Hyphomicrobiales bacterium]